MAESSNEAQDSGTRENAPPYKGKTRMLTLARVRRGSRSGNAGVRCARGAPLVLASTRDRRECRHAEMLPWENHSSARRKSASVWPF